MTTGTRSRLARLAARQRRSPGDDLIVVADLPTTIGWMMPFDLIGLRQFLESFVIDMRTRLKLVGHETIDAELARSEPAAQVRLE